MTGVDKHAFGDLQEEFRRAERSDKRKRIFLMVALFLVGSGSGIAISTYKDGHSMSVDDSPSIPQEDKSSVGAESAVAPDSSMQEGSSNPSATQSAQQPAAPSAAQTVAQPFDQVSFIATGKSVVAHYDQVLGFVTFGPSTSQAQKIANIKQAYTLDRQYFNEVTNLRLLTNQADSVPSKYTDLVKLAENGVSAISVGVDEMYRWSAGSSTNSIDSGSAMVAQGAALLLQFSQQLK